MPSASTVRPEPQPEPTEPRTAAVVPPIRGGELPQFYDRRLLLAACNHNGYFMIRWRNSIFARNDQDAWGNWFEWIWDSDDINDDSFRTGHWVHVKHLLWTGAFNLVAYMCGDAY